MIFSLYSLHIFGIPDARSVIQLTKRCKDTAFLISKDAKKQRRMHGVSWSDSSIKMAAIATEKGDEVAVGIPGSHTVWLWRSCFDELCRVYEGSEDRRLSRIFNMVLRYETLSRFKSGHQSALPSTMFEALQQNFGVEHECYASPLNRSPTTASYCSLFHDVDRYFGSQGSFFDWLPRQPAIPDTAQCFECNPPYDHTSIIACFKHIASILAQQRDGRPLSFVVIIPEQDSDPRDEVQPRRGARVPEMQRLAAPLLQPWPYATDLSLTRCPRLARW